MQLRNPLGYIIADEKVCEPIVMDGEFNDGLSMTEPDQSYSLRDILERFTTGLPPNLHEYDEYGDDDEIIESAFLADPTEADDVFGSPSPAPPKGVEKQDNDDDGVDGKPDLQNVDGKTPEPSDGGDEPS